VRDIFDRCPMYETAFVCVDGKKGPYCFDVFRSRDQYMISLFEKRNARARERDRGVERVWQDGVESVGVTFRPLGILSRIRGNSATNPWWPPADKHTAVKRYDILSLRELRRGSRGKTCALHEESVSTNDILENHCAMSHTLFIYYYYSRKNIRNFYSHSSHRVLSSIFVYSINPLNSIIR